MRRQIKSLYVVTCFKTKKQDTMKNVTLLPFFRHLHELEDTAFLGTYGAVSKKNLLDPHQEQQLQLHHHKNNKRLSRILTPHRNFLTL